MFVEATVGCLLRGKTCPRAQLQTQTEGLRCKLLEVSDSQVCLALKGFGPPGNGMREEMRPCFQSVEEASGGAWQAQEADGHTEHISLAGSKRYAAPP